MKNKTYVFLSVFSLIFAVYLIWGSFFTTKYSRIPVVFGPANIPRTEVEIQGRKHLLEIDFGSKFQLVLNNDILSSLKKDSHETLQGRDARGNTYTSPAYHLQKIQIGNRIFKDVIVKEHDKDYILNSVIYIEKDKNEVFKDKVGVIGRALLEKMNLLLDFQNSVMIECENISDLERIGYRVNTLIPVSFDVGRTGLILTINTTIGKVRLSLDTGSTVSMIRSSFVKEDVPKRREFGLSCIDTQMFEIGNRDFGRMNLYLYDITPELHEIDGLLGMDFLKNHIIYIDQKHRMIYVGDSAASTNL
jgi:hypothetical protein